MRFSLLSNNSIYIRASGKINPTCKVPSRSAALPACCLPLLWLLPGRRLLLYLPERGESPLPAAELGSRPTGVNWWPRELICQQRYNSRMRCRMTQQNQNEGVRPWGIWKEFSWPLSTIGSCRKYILMCSWDWNGSRSGKFPHLWGHPANSAAINKTLSA